MAQFPYKSFCWSLGTTSFRTKSFNKTIEEQLKLLREFWSLPINSNSWWAANETVQIRYYNFMKEKGFVEGEANNKAKDAREKTSGLVNIGIIDENRRITEVGLALLRVCDNDDFSDNNIFQIDKDSLIYLKQLLKVTNDINGKKVRPFIVLLYLLSKLGFLSLDEFTYLAPLCVDKRSTDFIIDEIRNIRDNGNNIDDVIVHCLLNMDNYQLAKEYFQNSDVTENVVMDIGMNRKSRSYDKSYFDLYRLIKEVYLFNNRDAEYDLYEATKKINIGIWWRNYLFDTTSSIKIKNDETSHLNATKFDYVTNERELKDLFFEFVHLFKAKATLNDYKDLNRRYFKTSDVILFVDEQVKLDVLPKAIFERAVESLYRKAYNDTSDLFLNIDLKAIDSSLDLSNEEIISIVSKSTGLSISSIEEARDKIQNERYEKFHHLLETKFTDENLLSLLNMFETRDDSAIQNMVTDNADIPTIFEYVLGIIWYKVSERKGKILDYLKLSLDADLLPKTHAGGGEADIVYEYAATEKYPAHAVLLEATLADDSNQRRMEMEPVSRHLGQHLLRTNNINSYCVFLTTFLHINVISDFRSRKATPYYDSQDYSKSVNGMKIMPVQTSELKTIITKKIKYSELFLLFNKAFESIEPPHVWYEKEIVNKL